MTHDPLARDFRKVKVQIGDFALKLGNHARIRSPHHVVNLRDLVGMQREVECMYNCIFVKYGVMSSGSDC